MAVTVPPKTGSKGAGGGGWWAGLPAPEPAPDRSRSPPLPEKDNPADQGQLAPGARDGRTVLDVGHDVLLDPRRHAGETRVGHLVRSDRGGGAEAVGRIGARRHAPPPTPFPSA